MLTINEIFYSIQGESTYAGCPCVFIRMTGCDIRCSWCDTPYAFHEGRKMSVDSVVTEVVGYACPLVEVTGGEPLLQDDVYPLVRRLLEHGKTVLVETGGHVSLTQLPPEVIKIVDIKCPGSGEVGGTDWSSIDRLTPRDQVKFVVKDRADYEYAREVLATRHLEDRCAAVLVSPVHGVLDPQVLASWLLEDRLSARLQLQVHKYIWGADARGV